MEKGRSLPAQIVAPFSRVLNSRPGHRSSLCLLYTVMQFPVLESKQNPVVCQMDWKGRAVGLILLGRAVGLGVQTPGHLTSKCRRLKRWCLGFAELGPWHCGFRTREREMEHRGWELGCGGHLIWENSSDHGTEKLGIQMMEGRNGQGTHRFQAQLLGPGPAAGT